jgi:Ca2+-binding RTX toxin-like protein
MSTAYRTALSGLCVTAATALVTGCLASPAFAASTGSASVTGSGTVVFTARAGEVNDVALTRSGRTVTIDDRVAVKAGTGCTAVKGDTTKVKCTTSGTTRLLRLSLGDKNDTLINKTGVAVFVSGGSGNDKITGGSADDELHGDSGNDTLVGAGNDDYLAGGTGADSLSGGAGDDVLEGGTGADTLGGGTGIDLADYGDRTRPIVADLDGSKGDGEAGENDTIRTDVESILGGDAADTLTGNAGANLLMGSSGNDVIHGGGGADIVVGGAGSDNLYGDAGNDELYAEDRGEGTTAGSATAKDDLDGGTDDDSCYALAAGSTTNCE